MKLQSILVALLGTGVTASAQVMPTENKTVTRTLPEEPGFKSDTEYKRQFEDVRKQLEALRQSQGAAKLTLQAAGAGVTGSGAAVGIGVGAAGGTNVSATATVAPESSSNNVGKLVKAQSKKPTKNARVKIKTTIWNPPQNESDADTDVEPEITPASGAKVFAVSEAAQAAADDSMTVLPAGSFVRAKVVSGVEANTLEPYPVLLQLEYAFTGPNKTRIDLSNCFMIAKARANLSTERVIMETETLSCVRENGEHFKTVARGYTAGEDSTFGSTGTLISKQGQVLLAAVLANIAKNAGEAIALAQQNTTITGVDRVVSATNVTGNKAAFVAGKSMVDAASLVAQWYLDYAKQLIPSIGIGSGQEVHVVMLDTIRVPTLKE